MEKFDYLVVGSGLYGSIFAHEVKAHGKSVLVVDKRPNIAGNIYTENIEGINVHKYGAHIFHTNNKQVWNYITQFAEFNRFTNSPVANYKNDVDEAYSKLQIIDDMGNDMIYDRLVTSEILKWGDGNLR